MSEKKRDPERSRDDSHLRKLVSETRAWMKSEGIEERPLDWEAVALEEEALWWRERLRQALSELATRSREFAEPLAKRLGELAATAESQAEAALEVSLDAIAQVGQVMFEPARACLRPGSDLQFAHASVGVRSSLGMSEDQQESVGIFISSTIPGARVMVEASQQKLTVEFWEPVSPPLVMLVPEDSSLNARVAQATATDGTARAVFEDLQPGRSLLSIYSSKENQKT